MDTSRRQEVKNELRAQGYSWDYIDSWPAKIDMYWHRDVKNPEGDVISPSGTLVPNQPGHPDHAARKSRIGLLPWPPATTCKCKSCRERDWDKFSTTEDGIVVLAETLVRCDKCEFIPKGDSLQTKKFALQSHVKKHGEKVPV